MICHGITCFRVFAVTSRVNLPDPDHFTGALKAVPVQPRQAAKLSPCSSPRVKTHALGAEFQLFHSFEQR